MSKSTNSRLGLLLLTQLLKAATNVRRGVPEWGTETITLPPGEPVKIARTDANRTVVEIREKLGQDVMLAPLPPSTMSGQGACKLRAWDERKIRTTAPIWAVCTAGTILDVTYS